MRSISGQCVHTGYLGCKVVFENVVLQKDLVGYWGHGESHCVILPEIRLNDGDR